MAKPSFDDASWDATMWSLWGLLYTGAESDNALRNGISSEYGNVKALLGQLGVQVDPLKSLVEEWQTELDGYARTITYGEANDVLLRLRVLRADIQPVVTLEQQRIAEEKKPKPKAKPATKSPPPSSSSPDVSSDEDDEKWAADYANTVMGHSAATAKTPPKLVKRAAAPKPSPEQVRAEAWRDRQRRMAGECDNCIAYGKHETCQDSVLNKLGLSQTDGGASQKRPSSENNNIRIIITREQQFWTLGVTHHANRVSGKYSVYRRVGAKNQFIFVSGNRLPDDSGN